MKQIKLLFLLAGLAFSPQAFSQAISHVMHVKLIDDTVDKYVVSENLELKIADGRAIVYSKNFESSYSYNVDSIAEYTFVDIETGIEDVEEDKTMSPGLEISYLNNEEVIVKGVADNAKARVYALSGQPVKAEISRTEGCMTISLISLPAGSYIIYINKEKSFKVLKK